MVGRVDHGGFGGRCCFLPDTCHDVCGESRFMAGFGKIRRDEEGAEGDGEVC